MAKKTHLLNTQKSGHEIKLVAVFGFVSAIYTKRHDNIIVSQISIQHEDWREKTAEQFTRNLLSNTKALEHIESRGISRDWVESGYIGLCAPYAENVFPLLKGRITVNIRDVHNRIVAFAGRIYEPYKELTERALWDMYPTKPADAQKRIEQWNRGKWINEPFSKARHLYMLNYAKKSAREKDYLVIVEGYLDALVLANKSMPNVAAVCGTALTAWHASTISRYCKHVVVLLDGDEAGAKATETVIPTLKEADLITHIVKLPHGYDPDTFVIKYGGRSLRLYIEEMILNDEFIRDLGTIIK